jgi:hypothetical protein
MLESSVAIADEPYITFSLRLLLKPEDEEMYIFEHMN